MITPFVELIFRELISIFGLSSPIKISLTPLETGIEALCVSSAPLKNTVACSRDAFVF